jgi:hypothetical protein
VAEFPVDPLEGVEQKGPGFFKLPPLPAGSAVAVERSGDEMTLTLRPRAKALARGRASNELLTGAAAAAAGALLLGLSFWFESTFLAVLFAIVGGFLLIVVILAVVVALGLPKNETVRLERDWLTYRHPSRTFGEFIGSFFEQMTIDDTAGWMGPRISVSSGMIQGIDVRPGEETGAVRLDLGRSTVAIGEGLERRDLLWLEEVLKRWHGSSDSPGARRFDVA